MEYPLSPCIHVLDVWFLGKSMGRFRIRLRPRFFASSSPILFPCSQPPQAAKPSSCNVNAAAAMFHLAGRSSPFSRSRSSTPCVVSDGSTGRVRSSSVAPTNSSPASSGLGACDVRYYRTMRAKGGAIYQTSSRSNFSKNSRTPEPCVGCGASGAAFNSVKTLNPSKNNLKATFSGLTILSLPRSILPFGLAHRSVSP
jgi:hypothetical protein